MGGGCKGKVRPSRRRRQDVRLGLLDSALLLEPSQPASKTDFFEHPCQRHHNSLGHGREIVSQSRAPYIRLPF